ncbi:dipeptidase [Bacillus sp. REN3]|uniref:dipeptidase n=1 Tax=Bacillus sp. REN3 TaxID=2802440 RepID=UPI001AEE960F|nr:dipeptidase [Bacillus sp. REN3]
MKVFDGHCDVLYKMFMDPSLEFSKSTGLHVTHESLKASCTKVQLFAIYVPESVHPDLKFQAALHMVDLFYERILTSTGVKQIISSEDIHQLEVDEIGALLTLEGCDAIGQDLMKLRTLLRLGVRSVGLTWNYGNHVADGALEKRGAGLSRFGNQVVGMLNEEQVPCDLSHLSERGFWDVIETSKFAFASHSNCDAICPHPRNLKDEQIKALIMRDSVIGITFVPEFLTGEQQARIDDVIRHVEHVCSLGGENHLGFGSDFDGIDCTVSGLDGNRQYHNLIEALQKHYSDIQVRKFLFGNMAGRLPWKK